MILIKQIFNKSVFYGMTNSNVDLYDPISVYGYVKSIDGIFCSFSCDDFYYRDRVNDLKLYYNSLVINKDINLEIWFNVRLFLKNKL